MGKNQFYATAVEKIKKTTIPSGFQFFLIKI